MLFTWDIVGHEKQLETLEREIKEGTIAHAYLFSGAQKTGKFSLAKQFAAILECPNNFCRSCPVCVQIEKETYPETIFMRDDGESIKIDAIRELIRKINLTHQGRYRIVLMQNIERMHAEAQNALLKTLEEPPSNTIFLMTTNEIDEVLPTIKSRVRQYYFPHISDSKLRGYLEKRFGKAPHLDEVVSIAQGRPGLAIRLMEKPETLADQRTLYNQIEIFLKKNDLSQKFAYVEGLSKEEKPLLVFIDAFTRYLRKVIYDFVQKTETPITVRFTLKDIVNLFEYLEKTRYLLRRNVNKRLVLENLMIQTEK